MKSLLLGRTLRSSAMILPEQGGKAIALNHGLAAAHGEVIVFTDARQTIASEALKHIVANFADPDVGCVSGELMIGQGEASGAQGVGLYWRMEKKIRYWEGLAGSTVGATGALYAVRKNLISPLPPGTILDDVYIPLQVVRQGQRVVFEPRALAFDPLTPDPKQEFRRKLRTLIGNYQLLQLAPWVLTRPNPLRLQFVCHKLLRLLVPFALVGMLVSTLWLRKDVYELALVLQLVFYALAGLRLSPREVWHCVAIVGYFARLSRFEHCGCRSVPLFHYRQEGDMVPDLGVSHVAAQGNWQVTRCRQPPRHRNNANCQDTSSLLKRMYRFCCSWWSIAPGQRTGSRACPTSR